MEATLLVPESDDVQATIQLVPRVGDQVVLYDDPQAYEVESVTWRIPGDRVLIKLKDWRTSAVVETVVAVEMAAGEGDL